MPKLYLVGSGPGDADLITIKGLKAIQKADAILYDSLANKELLSHAKEGCIKIFAGKRAGKKSIAQEEINSNLVSLSKEVETIVRLKGGDPMVFGRSFEEIVLARENGIEVEVIPGISSFNAFAANYQAPITKRKESYGFWVISASTHLKELSKELKIASESSSNIIIFMGLFKLNLIVNEFKKHKPLNYPIGVFQGISTDNEEKVIGTLSNIEEKVNNTKIGTPALVVIGKAVTDIK